MSGVMPQEEFTDELRPGTRLLHHQYTIESFLKVGGFGMTYLASDSLDRVVVIKECFPGSLCSRDNQAVRARSRAHQDEFRSVVRLFVQEARRLAKVRHPNIVGVHQVFEDNETAYMALDFIEGDDLLDIIEDDRARLKPDQIREILEKLLHAIGFVHDHSLLHRDIAPDNILLDKTGNPVLIDFGAARERASKKSRVLSALHVVKDGYSPQEFYISNGPQGPSSDLYSLGATFYHLLTGEAPPVSQLRLAAVAAKEADPYKPIAGRVAGYDAAFLEAIDKAMNLFPKDRPQSAQEWLDLIDIEKRQAAALAHARTDTIVERAISRLVAETNEAVLEAKRQEELRKKEIEKAPSVEKKKKPYFSWQLEDDWLLGEDDADESTEDKDAEAERVTTEHVTSEIHDTTTGETRADDPPRPRTLAARRPAKRVRNNAPPDGMADNLPAIRNAETGRPRQQRGLWGRFGKNLKSVLWT